MIPKEFRAEYRRDLAKLKENPGGFRIFREPLYEKGFHPENFIDYECAFAAFHIRQVNPKKILDLGSYRHFILGLLAHFPITTIDVRNRKPICQNETVITCDAKRLNLPNHSFDLVLSLCALEHFGLGRYGDEFDLSADQRAFGEMVRVLKPGGRLIFTTTVTRAQPSIAFNAHRVYSHEMLQSICAGLIRVEEKFYSHKLKGFCSPEEVTTDPKCWDVYLGCWEKRGKGEGRRVEVRSRAHYTFQEGIR
jgi:SAM-dependent methyltransferase